LINISFWERKSNEKSCANKNNENKNEFFHKKNNNFLMIIDTILLWFQMEKTFLFYAFLHLLLRFLQYVPQQVYFFLHWLQYSDLYL
jgi:hypothetical protein